MPVVNEVAKFGRHSEEWCVRNVSSKFGRRPELSARKKPRPAAAAEGGVVRTFRIGRRRRVDPAGVKGV
jgi:hypothetical protein